MRVFRASKRADLTGKKSPIQAAHGSTNATPVPAKSAVLRVTTVKRCAIAVAAIMASRWDRGTGICRDAHTG